MLGSDEIFIFIDTDYDSATGYMKNSVGAEKLIHIVGHYGIITSSTISNYNPNPEIENDWNWIGKTDTPTANDKNELEVLGTDGNFYFYVKSWNHEKDDIEAEIYNKITLPDDEPENGSRAGTPSFPSSWTSIITDDDDGVAGDVEILSLAYASDSDFIFFRIETESDVNIADSTFGVIIDDVSLNSGTYEAACGTWYLSSTNTRAYVYQWNAVDSFWDTAYTGSDYNDHIKLNGDVTSGFSGLAVACDKDEIGFTVDLTNDVVRAVSQDGGNGREWGGDWIGENIPSTNLDDITDSTALGIPEFSTLLMPVASVLLIVGNRFKNKKAYQH